MDQKEQIKKELQLKANYGVSDPKNIADVVNNKIVDLVASGRLKTPKNYVVGNAMTSAFLTLSEIKDKNGKPVLESCSKESVANALLNMGVLGLTPAKSQCYFIPYGNQLQLSVSYFGKQAILKRIPNIMSEVNATLIYNGDELEIGFNALNERCVLNHKTSWKAQKDNTIEGVYATVKQKQPSGEVVERCALMTIDEVREAWTMSKTSKDHKNFTGEFVKRTAINRLCKVIIQTSNDDDLVEETMQEVEYAEYDFDQAPEEKIEKTITANANTGEVIGFKEEPKPSITPNKKFSDEELNEIEKEEEQIEEAPADYDPFA